jgi:hypothetical protein
VVTTGRAGWALSSGADGGEWFVTGEGEVGANYYVTILMLHNTVTINVTAKRTAASTTPPGDPRIRHRLIRRPSPSKRNALNLLGNEVSDVGGLPGGIL